MNELKFWTREAARGRISRREFMGRASALGISAGLAGSMLSSEVLAQGPKKGGHIKVGSIGGESTNTQDPAYAGHGTYVEKVNGYAWLPVDAEDRNCLATLT